MTTSVSVALTIAGSDSSGGAGIQADLKTFHAFGVFGTSALTAITVQNTLGVSGVHAIPLDIVRGQIEAVAVDMQPSACKTGMLATRELVQTVARCIRDYELPNYVLDPVMVATSGDRLLDTDAQSTVMTELVPLAALVTPNLDEAGILIGFEVRDVSSMERAARALVAAGAGAALVKGGHMAGAKLIDVFFDGTAMHHFRHERIDTTSTHGTGCTLSAGIAAGLARGASLPAAVERALDFVHRAIAQAPNLGRGHGPLNHLIAPAPLP